MTYVFYDILLDDLFTGNLGTKLLLLSCDPDEILYLHLGEL